jgi:adenylate cyclase
MSEPANATTQRHLTPDELALEAGVARQYVDELAAAGAIERDRDGNHHADDVRRVRLAWALRQGGIGGDDLLWAMATGLLPLDQVSRTWPTPGPMSSTFRSFTSSLGERGSLLPSVYAAFGLASPGEDSVVGNDEEALVRAFIETWTMVDEQPDAVIRAARIAGEGVRRIQEATLDLFDEYGGSPPQRMQRGLSVEDANRPSMAMIAVMSELLPWLLNRHSEDEVFRRIVAYIEARAAEAGRVAPRDAVEPAIAFVDLAGYTQLTQAAGDQEAAAIAARLQDLAMSSARGHGGRLVKLLGDGVMLRFGSPVEAVRGVLGLMDAIDAAGLPPAHAGIASGPVIVRDADVYGHTVNLAARIAGHAPSGLLLVTADLGPALAAERLAVVDAGRARLKGMSDEVAMLEVVRSAGGEG